MTQFHNVNFPLYLAESAHGGPIRSTEIVSLASGGEYRNNNHAHSRRRYNAGAGIRSAKDAQTVIAFYEARGGQLHSFRFRDPLDYASAEAEFIGEGDSVQTEFQLVKTYADNAGAWTRHITKPRAETVTVTLDDDPGTVTVDELTGIITFASPPSLGVTIRAAFEFDVPVRFGADHLDLSMEDFAAGKVLNVPLLEVPHE